MGQVEHVIDRERYTEFGGDHEGRRRLGRPERRWEDNTERNLQDIDWKGLKWTRLSQ